MPQIMDISKQIKCFKYIILVYIILLAKLYEILRERLGDNGKVPLQKKLLFSIWFLAKQECFLSTGDRFGFALSTAHLVFTQIIKEIANLKAVYIKFPAAARQLDISNLSGAAQIVLGGLLLWGHLGYSLILENKLWAPSTVQLCIGPFIIIFCWLGWNATSGKNRCQLIWFSLLLIVLVCVQLFICGWSIAIRETLPTSAEFHVENSFHQFLQNHAKSNQTHAWNRIQYDLRCCGIHGSIDYRRGGSTSIPFSCCVRPENPTDQICSGVYSRGCLDILSLNSRDLLLKSALVAFCMAVAQSTGIFCVIHTILLIKKQPREELPTVTLKSKSSQELSPLASHRQSKNI